MVRPRIPIDEGQTEDLAAVESSAEEIPSAFTPPGSKRELEYTAIVEPTKAAPAGELASKLRRVTSSGTFIPEIDGLRFIAIASVLAYHINGELLKVDALKGVGARFAGQIAGNPYLAVVNTWHFGVELFFTISGFILGLPFLRHHWKGAPKPRLGAYYVRRVTRIEPPLLINLCICFAILLAIKRPPLGELVPHFGASLFYVHGLVYHQMSAVNFVTWSLEIEAQFYLLAPLLALLFRARQPLVRWALLIFTTLLTAGISWKLLADTPWLQLTLLRGLPFFLAGFMLAAWYLGRDTGIRPNLASDLVALAGWAGLQWLLFDEGLASHLARPFVIVVAYAAMFRGRVANFLITRPVFTVIGGMCYTIYLYHPFLKSALKHLFFRIHVTNTLWVNGVLQILLLGGLIVVVSSVLFALFEKPFMYHDWPRKIWSCLRARVEKITKTSPHL
jgi:peptidoglycan/LPS O-acetylase OafA/YrhL